jgi:putative PIN family toxin of toxin-antitoxin system
MLSYGNCNIKIQVLIITLDTNVLFSALYTSSGASHRILRLILDEKIKAALTIPVYFEYLEVLLSYKGLAKLELTKEEVTDVLDLLALLAKKHKIYYLLRPNLIDESDNIFVECAFASNSDYIVSGNVKHFKSSQLKGFKFKVITPKNFYRMYLPTAGRGGKK